MRYKKGNILIVYFLICLLLFIILFSVCILYMQIDIQINNIKEDIHRIVINSAIKNCNRQSLDFFSYNFDIQNMKKDITIILQNQYSNIGLEKLVYDSKSNSFFVEISVRIIPIIKFRDYKEINILLNEKVKFKFMEVINKEE